MLPFSTRSALGAVARSLPVIALMAAWWIWYSSDREPQEAGETYEVHVDARTGYGGKAKAASGIRFCLHLVHKEVGAPPPERVADGITGPDGTAILLLDSAKVEGWLASGRRLEARLEQPGYQRRISPLLERNAKAEPPSARSFRTRLFAFKGGSVDVLPVTASGDPVLGAKLTPLVEKLGGWSEVPGKSVQEVQPGLIALHFPQESTVTVFGDGGRYGTGRLDDVELAVATNWAVNRSRGAEPLTMLITGDGVVRGRLKDDAGRPSAGIDVKAISERSGHNEYSRGIVPNGLWLEQLDSSGLLFGTGRTDSNGRFVIEGLARDEPFLLWAMPTSANQGLPTFLGRASSAKGAAPSALTHGRPHLVVDLVDGAGQFIRRSEGERSSITPKNLKAPVVLVCECVPGRPDGAAAIASGHSIRPLADRPLSRREAQPVEPNADNSGEIFEVEEEKRYVVGVLGGGFRFAPRIVDVPKGSGQIRLTFRAEAELKTNDLMLSVSREAGEVDDREVEFVVLDPETLTPLFRRPYRVLEGLGAGGRVDLIQLPPSRYLVGVVGPDAASLVGGGLAGTPKQFGRTELIVDLREGNARLDVPLRGSPGLSLTLTGQPLADSLDSLRQATRAEFGETFSDAEVLDKSTWARVFLESPDGRRVRIPFASSDAERHLRGWQLGRSRVKGGLPEGQHVLSVELVDGRRRTLAVQLDPGRTTEIELDFDE